MDISAVSSSTAAYQPNTQNAQRQNFQQLMQSLQSGDLSGAQAAYATLTQNAPAPGAATNNPIQQAISTIGSALQSGDLAGAQKAMQSLQQTMKSHHGHHHHKASSSQDQSSTSAQSSTGISTLSAATGSVGITV